MSSAVLIYRVPPPPTDAQRRAELRDVHAVTDRRTPAQDARAIDLDKRGGWGLWQAEAAAYRKHVGFFEGWAGTARMNAAMAAAAVQGQVEKHRYALKRPFQLDSSIQPLGPIPHDTSYPSGHSAASAAAATVLEGVWPERTSHYEHLVRSVEWARVYSGVHFPSDVAAGDALGRAAGRRFTDDD
ncbi:MAG: phosphoesterase PA-phosphatase related protein [Thermoleophilia bacterium]|nr:phosphoesterase PA-phosphatase related protein [Thermoleophilia bacterium]